VVLQIVRSCSILATWRLTRVWLRLASQVCVFRDLGKSGCVDREVRICKDEVPAQRFMLMALARLRVRLGTLILRGEGGSERSSQRLSHMMLLQHLAT
jgi:hypothetical protein